ncbi:MAG: hypothetical protein OIF50_11700, partial [Flavobacteriaceae bacterium]|nr:hypothetical protein [Flavobacteriaceae bacterium]
IYWQGVVNKTPESDLSSLEVHLSEIEKGIGAHKSPTEYGAFPIDPYSHTPFHKGVQQPGMTGQVKEDILVRFRRLGLGIEDACITFRPNLLQASDYLSQDTSFSYFNVEGKAKSLALEKGSLAFTYCQIPILYIRAEENKILVLDHQKNKKEKAGLQLDRLTSNAIWKRNNSISTVIVYFKKA